MIYVTPQSKLPAIVQTSGASHLVTLLTEGSEFSRPDTVSARTHLHLTMHDIAEAREGLSPPNAGHIETLLDYARDWNRSGPLVICCYAGISRSTAAAYLLGCFFQPDRSEARLAALLRRKAPSATPNRLIVSLGDRALGRNGRMVAAISAIGRGAEAYEGVPFSLEV